MTIQEICSYLRSELYNTGYEYGFYLNGKKYKPNMNLGFDEEYFKLSKTIYRVQRPEDTKREKIGTCIDACILMREMLCSIFIDSHIWLICHREKGSVHTIITFESEQKSVYLELTPQSRKDWYGKEIIYPSLEDFVAEFNNNGFDIFNVTDDIIVSEAPSFLLSHL